MGCFLDIVGDYDPPIRSKSNALVNPAVNFSLQPTNRANAKRYLVWEFILRNFVVERRSAEPSPPEHLAQSKN
jgi:hypothetical protein